jgi:hypothetical protein
MMNTKRKTNATTKQCTSLRRILVKRIVTSAVRLAHLPTTPKDHSA